MTGYLFYPFLTGTDASQSGIYGLRWFDKKREKGQLRNYVGRTNVQMNYDVKASPQNLFELAGSAYTCSINSYMNRGVKERVKRIGKIRILVNQIARLYADEEGEN